MKGGLALKYLKFAWKSFIRKPVFNIIIMLELAAVLIVGNILIAVVNSRSVYYEPYEEIMNHEGYVFTPRITGKPENMKKLTEQYHSLQGDISITCSNIKTIVSESELLRDEHSTEKTKYRSLYAIDDSIYSKFNIPLTSGHWGSSSRNSKGQIEAVAVLNREAYIKVGDVIPFRVQNYDEETNSLKEIDMGELLIVGTIQHGGYYPTVRLEGTAQGSSGKKNTLDVRNMYTTGSLGNEGAEFYVSSDADPLFSVVDDPETVTAFITYNSNPSDEIRQANNELLAGIKGSYIRMSDFKESSDSYLYEQYIRLLPILLGVFVIVIAELICSAALHTKEQIRNYGVYFLCGARFKGCLKESLAYSMLILSGAVIIGLSAFALFQSTEYAELFEHNFAANNMIITFAIIAAMLVLSLVIPFFMVRRTSPVKTIKET